MANNLPATNPDKTPARNKLEAIGIDAICDMIADTKTLSAIAKEIGVSIGTLSEWLSSGENSARSTEARRSTAKIWDERAEEELRNVSNGLQLGIARELAHHYRWRCKMISPEYRDQPVQVGVGIVVNINRAVGKDDADHIVDCRVETGQDESDVS